MHKQTRNNAHPSVMKIENFDEIQARYQMMPLANRAMAVISDAKPALTGVSCPPIIGPDLIS